MPKKKHRACPSCRPVAGRQTQPHKTIVPIIDADDHATYAEPFTGMGGIFFKRTSQPACEVINDASRDVANLFRILQRHYPQFIEILRFQLTARAEFERLAKTDPVTLTDLERAARFLYLQRTAFGGKIEGRTFGVSPDRTGRFDLTNIVPMLEDRAAHQSSDSSNLKGPHHGSDNHWYRPGEARVSGSRR